jgi:ferredoxin-nitrite reductase
VGDRHLETYHIYVGDSENYEKFGRQIYQYVSFAEIPALIEQMLKAYQIHRLNPTEPFTEFVNRYETSQIKELFTIPALLI